MNDIFSQSSTYNTVQSIVKDAKSIRDSLMGTYQNTSIRVSEIKRNNRYVQSVFRWFKGKTEDPENNGPSSLEEPSDEFDPGFKTDEEETEPAHVLDADSMRDFVTTQTREMHKIAEKQIESKLITTVEITKTIDTRTSETIAILRQTDTLTQEISKKLDIFIQTTESRLDQIRKESNRSRLHSYSGHLTLDSLGNYMKNNRQRVTKSLAQALMDTTGLTAVDAQVTETIQSFQHNLLLKLFELPLLKKYMNPFGGYTKDYSSLISSQYDHNKAVFDNMTQKSIITIIPNYLRQITQSITGKRFNVSSHGALTTEKIENRFVRSIDVTFNINNIKDQTINELTTNAKAIDEQFTSADMREVLRIMVQQYVYFIYSSEQHATNHLNPDFFKSGGDAALHIHIANLLAKGKGKTAQYWMDIIQVYSTKLIADKKYRSTFSTSINRALRALDEAAARNIADTQSVTDTQFTQEMFDERAMARMSHDSSEFEYEGKTYRQLIHEGKIKLEDLTVEQRQNLDKPIKGFSEIADKITDIDAIETSDILLHSRTSKLDYIASIFALLNRGVNVYFIKNRNHRFGKLQLQSTSTPEQDSETIPVEQTQPTPIVEQPQSLPDTQSEDVESPNSDEEKISETTSMMTAMIASGGQNTSQIRTSLRQVKDLFLQNRLKTIVSGTIDRNSKKEPKESRIGKIISSVLLFGKNFVTGILSGAKSFFNSAAVSFGKKLLSSITGNITRGASAVGSGIVGLAGNVVDAAKQKKSTQQTTPSTTQQSSTTTQPQSQTQTEDQSQNKKKAEGLFSKFGTKMKGLLSKSEFGKGILSAFGNQSRIRAGSLRDQSTSGMEEILTSPSPTSSVLGSILSAFNSLKETIQDWFHALEGKQDAEKKRRKQEEKKKQEEKHSNAFNMGKIVGGMLNMLTGILQAALTVIMSLKGLKLIMDLVHRVLKNSLKPLNKAFRSIYKAIKPVMKTVQKILRQVVSYVAELVESIVEIMQPILEMIGPLLDEMFKNLQPFFELLTETVNKCIVPFTAIMQVTVVPLLQTTANFLDIIIGITETGFGMICQGLGTILITNGFLMKLLGAGSMFDTGKSIYDTGTKYYEIGVEHVKKGFSQQQQLRESMIDQLFGDNKKEIKEVEQQSQQRRADAVAKLNGSPMDGLYGSGDANAPYKFSDKVSDALDTIKTMASGIFAMFMPEEYGIDASMKDAQDREAYAKAQIDTASLSDDKKKSIDERAFELFKNSTVNEQLYGESDDDYRKRYEKNKERYWAQAATEILYDRVKEQAAGSEENANQLLNETLGLDGKTSLIDRMRAYDSSVESGSALSGFADFMSAVLDSGDDEYYDDEYYDDDGYYYEGGTGDIIQAASETFVATKKAAGHYLQKHGEAISNVRFDDGMVIDMVSDMCTGMLAAIVKRMGYYLPSHGRQYTDTYQGDPYMTPTIGSNSWGFDNSDGKPNIFNRDGSKSDDWKIVKDGSSQSGDLTFAILSQKEVHGHMPVFQNDKGYWFGFNGGRYDSRENSVRLGDYYLSHGTLPPSTNPGIQTEGKPYDQQIGALASPMSYKIRYVGPKSKSRRKIKKSTKSTSGYKYSGTFTPRLTRPEAGNKYYITTDSGGWSHAIPGNPAYRDKNTDVLPNCTGYAYGRYHEIAGRKEMDLYDPVNAENSYENARQHGRKVSKTPSLGAVLVLSKGKVGDQYGDGPGHVAVVEQINSDGSIVTSESGWSSSNPFWTQTRRKEDNNYAGSSYGFVGFIHQDKSIKSRTTTSSVGKRVGGTTKYISTSKTKSATKSTSKKTNATRNDWIDTVAMMFEGYYYNGDKYYDNKNVHTFKIRDGRTVKARPDCSGMLGAAMTAMGYTLDWPPSSSHYNVTGSNGNLNFIHDPDGSVSNDWKLLKFNGDNLQPGDITGNKYHASFPVTNLSAAYPKGFDAGGTKNIKESAIAARAYLDGKSDIPWRSAMGSGAFSSGAGAWNIVRYVGGGSGTRSTTSRTTSKSSSKTSKLRSTKASTTRTSNALSGNTTEEKIFNYLTMNAGMSEKGAAGMMGCMKYESAMKPNNLEDSYNKQFGLTDEQYTAMVDNGKESKTQFIYGRYATCIKGQTPGRAVGYGLTQFTSPNLKKALYERTVEHGKSIADIGGQLDSVVDTLKSSKVGSNTLFDQIKQSSTPTEANKWFLWRYEAGSSYNSDAAVARAYPWMGMTGINNRHQSAEDYYNQYSTGRSPSTRSSSATTSRTRSTKRTRSSLSTSASYSSNPRLAAIIRAQMLKEEKQNGERRTKSNSSNSRGKERLIKATAEIFEAYQKTNPDLTYKNYLWPKSITTRSGHTRQVRPDCSGTISAGIQELGFTLRSSNGKLLGDDGLRTIELGNQTRNTLIYDSPTATSPSTKWQVLEYSKDKLQRGDITVYPNSGTGKNDGHASMPIVDLQTTPRGFDGGSGGIKTSPAAAVAYLSGKSDANIPYPQNSGMSKMKKIWRYTGSGDAVAMDGSSIAYNAQPMQEFMLSTNSGYSNSLITPDASELIPYQVQTGPTFVPDFNQMTDEETPTPTIINNYTTISGLEYLSNYMDEFTTNEFNVQSVEIRQLAYAINEEFPEYMDYYFGDDDDTDEEDIDVGQLISMLT